MARLDRCYCMGPCACENVHHQRKPVSYSEEDAVPLKRSMSFLSSQELFSYKAIPAIGVVSYFAASVGATANSETYVQWLGKEYPAVLLGNVLTAVSIGGIGCYIYGRRHIRHAGAFERLVYPGYASILFVLASHFGWTCIKEMMGNQDYVDYHSRVFGGLVSSAVFLAVGRSYLKFIDHW